MDLFFDPIKNQSKYILAKDAWEKKTNNIFSQIGSLIVTCHGTK